MCCVLYDVSYTCTHVCMYELSWTSCCAFNDTRIKQYNILTIFPMPLSFLSFPLLHSSPPPSSKTLQTSNSIQFNRNLPFPISKNTPPSCTHTYIFYSIHPPSLPPYLTPTLLTPLPPSTPTNRPAISLLLPAVSLNPSNPSSTLSASAPKSPPSSPSLFA